MTRARPAALVIDRKPITPPVAIPPGSSPGAGAHWLGRTRRRSTVGPFLVPFVMIAIFGLMVLALGHP